MNKFNTVEFQQNPYLLYSELRASNTPVFVEHTQNTSSPGLWLFSNYNTAIDIMRDSNTYIKSNDTIKSAANRNLFDFIMLNCDGLEHKKLRKLIQDFFTHKSLKVIESEVEDIIVDELKSLSQFNQFDFIEKYADVVPLRIFAQFMGFRETNLSDVRVLTIIISDGFDSFKVTNEVLRAQGVALQQLEAIIDDEIAFHTDTLNETNSDKLLPYLINCKNNGVIDSQQLRAMVIFLLFAGHETTAHLFGTGIYLLLQHQSQLRRLQQSPDLLDSTVNEILRYESPEQRTTFRMTTKELRFGDMIIPKDSQIAVLLGSVNRDPDIFVDPDVFDISRKQNRHLAFGYGIHNCLGQHLSRLELRTLLTHFWTYFPHAKIAQKPQWRPNTFFRGLEHLHLDVSVS
jgi:cytochrome P450